MLVSTTIMYAYGFDKICTSQVDRYLHANGMLSCFVLGYELIEPRYWF